MASKIQGDSNGDRKLFFRAFSFVRVFSGLLSRTWLKLNSLITAHAIICSFKLFTTDSYSVRVNSLIYFTF